MLFVEGSGEIIWAKSILPRHRLVIRIPQYQPESFGLRIVWHSPGIRIVQYLLKSPSIWQIHSASTKLAQHLRGSIDGGPNESQVHLLQFNLIGWKFAI